MTVVNDALTDLGKKIDQVERLSMDEALWLWNNAPLEWLANKASARRQILHGNNCYYNRNMHWEPTNKCIYSCKFCAFYRTPKSTETDGAWDYSANELLHTLEKYPQGTITEVHITGGVHPDRGVDWAATLLSAIKLARPEIHRKAFTAVEIDFFSKRSGITISETLNKLRQAGLDSLPGGGAEIFNTEIRKKIAGGKAPSYSWLSIHREAHRIGLGSNATMLYGHVEQPIHRLQHMEMLRQLQDETGGFRAFIPLRYRNQNNALSDLSEVTPDEDMRVYAISRLFLDNISHLKSYWVMLGMPLAIRSLEYGVDDLDGTVDDSTKIYSMAGGMDHPSMSSHDLCAYIKNAQRNPVERNSNYQTVF